jgi:hypothetical protein
MEFIKNFGRFIKENSDTQKHHDDELYNIQEIDEDMLKNLKNLPSELWTEDMVEAYKKYESMLDELDNVDDEDGGCCDDEYDEPDNKKMLHNPKNYEIKEKYSEMEDYEVKDVFDEEEEEEED